MLSVGIAVRTLGFQAVVHMSSDAKLWKVEPLRRHGVEVVQHDADYQKNHQFTVIASEFTN